MALAEVVAAAPDSAHHTGDPARTMVGTYKGDPPQEHCTEGNSGDNEQLRRLDAAAEGMNGYNIPMLSSYGGGMGCDSRQVFSGMLTDNGQSVYYTPSYEFPQQSIYCSQPQAPYVSNMGSGTTGYCGPQYGAYYHQMSPGLMQYYPAEQEVSKGGPKKLNAKDATQNAKTKPGGMAKPGYQAGPKSVPADSSSQWGLYPATVNGAYYGSAMGFDCYVPQHWHSSARGFQPIPPPQNIGAQGNCNPPVTGGGPGRFQNFPRVNSSPNISGRAIKGSSVKGSLAGGNWRAKDVSKSQGKVDGGASGVVPDSGADTMPKVLSGKPKMPQVHESESVLHPPPLIAEQQCSSVNRTDYNKEDFQVSFELAKFFIIKSYSEDDVHKSIKYGVWSSTPNGNKRLDDAYRKAQEKLDSPSTSCPVFFFFSVNCSGQFCGVAEMVGSVDFGKNMDFWLQGKWNGCLPVKWHIIKDVPNGHFRHIILSNNDNKPVTHSRDTQEVHFHEGLEMLKIFKFFPMRTSLLDDFGFYDGRQRVLQERKSRQQLRQQVVKQVKDRASEKVSNMGDVILDSGKECCTAVKSVERTNNVAATPPTQVKENGGLVEADNPEPKVDIIVQKVIELQVDDKVDPAKTPKAKDGSMQQNASIKEQDACKGTVGNNPNVVKDQCTKVKPSEGLPVSAADQSKAKSASAEAVTTSGKEDAARLVINYKKALLEGIQGKVIVLDQTIGA